MTFFDGAAPGGGGGGGTTPLSGDGMGGCLAGFADDTLKLVDSRGGSNPDGVTIAAVALGDCDRFDDEPDVLRRSWPVLNCTSSGDPGCDGRLGDEFDWLDGDVGRPPPLFLFDIVRFSVDGKSGLPSTVGELALDVTALCTCGCWCG